MALDSDLQTLLQGSKQDSVNPNLIPIPKNQLELDTLHTRLFNENQNEFGMSLGGVKSFLKISDANIAVMAIGVMVSSTVGGMLGNMFSGAGKWGAIIAGGIIMYFGKKNKLMRDFGAGVVIGGIASAFSGLGQSLNNALSGINIGGIGGGNDMSMNPPSEFQETKYTFGGSDGVFPTQPNRRTFS